MLNFIREQWVAGLIVLGLVFVVVSSRENASNQAKAQAGLVRTAAVQRCIDTAPLAAYDIAFQYEAGRARSAAGNIVTGERYAALADAGIRTVAAPKGWAGRKELVEVTYTKLPSGKMRAHLTPRAEKLQIEGCQQAYATLL
jgi:hypothetical protein